jgi:thiosulfate/3-mercaptopyruvate sulfurtransferase
MDHTTLIDVPTLRSRLSDPLMRVIDCRFELGHPEVGRGLYLKGHIPSALYAHLDEDLAAPRTPWSGRHPLPDATALGATFSRFGIDDTVQVVAYDDSGGAYAARLWWLLRWLGHSRVAVLDGGFGAWKAAGLPVSIPAASVTARHFTPRPDPACHVSGDELGDLLAQQRCALLDARSPERFEGRIEPLDPRAGHVPGAQNFHFARNLDADGRFLSPEILAAQFRRALRGRPPETVVAMCGSGVTACHNLLAMEVAGLGGGRLYPGSFSEWSRDAARPIATGP